MARIVVLTPNPAVDVTYRVAEQRLGETVRVTGVSRRAGGKGLNVVRVLDALGVDAVAVHPVGGAAGEWLGAALAADGIRVDPVETDGETRTTVAVVDDLVHPTLLSEPGAPLSDETWAALAAQAAAHATPGGFLVLSGSVPPDTQDRHVAAVVEAARAAGAKVVADTSGPALLAAAAAGADVVKPNEAEAREATGTATAADAAAALLDAGAGAVVLSRGADGFLSFVPGSAPLVQAAVPGVSGNPTGAGDAATAGLVASLAAGGTWAQALRRAAVLGAAAVCAPVAGEVDTALLDELDARLPAAGR